jgi:outer membrane protein assembly factor BamB
MNDQGNQDDAARAQRLNILRAMAAETEPVSPPLAATPPNLNVERARETPLSERPARRGARVAIFAGSVVAALAIVVVGVALALIRPERGTSAPRASTPAASKLLAPQLASATVYIASNNGSVSHLYAVNAATGRTDWRFPFGPSYTSPIVSGSTIYTASSDGNVYALNAVTGTQIWAIMRPDQRDAYLRLDGSVLYVDDDAGYVYAFDAATGKQLWRFDALAQSQSYAFYSAPAVADGLVFAAAGNYQAGAGALYAFNAASGAVRWRAPTGFDANGMPVAINGTVYLTATDGSISAFAANSGAKRWRVNIGSSFNSGVAIAGQTLYAISQDGAISAVNTSTGAVDWRVTESGSQGGYLNAAPLVTDNVLYVGTQSGVLYALKASDGSHLWQWRASTPSAITSTPALLDGALYFGDANGYLYALRASNGALAWRASLDDSINASPVLAG